MPAGRVPVAAMVAVGFGYLLAAFAGYALSSDSAFATVWPANGVLVAAMLRAPRRAWPYLLLGTFPANYAFNFWCGYPTLLNVAYWMANVAGSVTVATLVRRMAPGRFTFEHPVAVVRFVGAVMVGTPLGALLGAVATSPWHADLALWSSWRSWWTSDLLGILTVAPLIVSFPAADGGLRALRPSRECAAFACALAVAFLVVVAAPAFGVSVRIALAPFLVPLLAWSAMRLGVAGTSWAIAVLSLLAILGEVRGVGMLDPGAGYTTEDAMVIQAVLSGLTVTFLVVAAAVQQHRRSADELSRRDEDRQTLVAGLVHEIRNPLNVIFANVELAQEGPDDEATRLRVLTGIRSAARRILTVTDEATSSERDAPERPETVWLPALWRALKDDCEVMPRAAGVRLEWDSQVAAVAISTDRHRLSTIVHNLVSNALKYTDRGLVSVTLAVDAEAMVITVSDTGIGIASADRERVFGLYSRGRDQRATSRPGSGVGLHLVRRFATQLGGTVRMSSALGHGSTFEVVLPLQAAAFRVA